MMITTYLSGWTLRLCSKAWEWKHWWMQVNTSSSLLNNKNNVMDILKVRKVMIYCKYSLIKLKKER